MYGFSYRHSWLPRILGVLLTALCIVGTARAEYPERVVRMIIGLQAGASTDVLGRSVAKQLSERLGAQFIVENRPGAATRIGMEAVRNAEPDGYTLGIVNAVAASFPLMFKDVSFSPPKDFRPITLMARAPSFLVVRHDLPVTNVEEFVAYAKKNDGKITYGHGGNGSNPHVATAALVASLGVQATPIAYKGNAPTALAVGSGEVDFALLDYASFRALAERGSVRLLAVTEPARSTLMPDVPTGAEAGLTPEIEGLTPWFMLVAPAGTPDAIVTSLSQHVTEVLKDGSLQQTLLNMGIEVQGSDPAQAQATFLEHQERMRVLSNKLNLPMN